MATLNVPGSFATIADAIAAAAAGDTIVVAAGYGGNESATVTVNNLTFDIPDTVSGIVLTAGPAALQLTLLGGSDVRVVASGGDNTVIGNDGDNDLGDGGGGNDSLTGGGGDDRLTSTGGSDTLSGEGGDDQIFLDTGASGTIDGGTGNDTVFAGDLGSYVFSNVEALDTYYGFVVASVAQIGEFGDFRAINGAQDNQIEISLLGQGGVLDFTNSIGGTLTLGIRDAGLTSGIEIIGSSKGDELFGSAFADVLNGGDGNDFLAGGDGNDTLFGDAGRDLMSGGNGRDVLVGNGDGDTATYFDASGVNIRLSVTTAQNTGSAGIDTLVGIDDVIGSDYVDQLSGHAGDNRLVGRLGDDVLKGLDGNDAINAGGGNDLLYGGDGADLMKGGRGDDRLVGGAGKDRLDGGLGNDTFVFGGHFGRDRIADFTVGEDVIEFTSAFFVDFADMMTHATQVGADTQIAYGGSRRIDLLGVDRATLTESSFTFA